MAPASDISAATGALVWPNGCGTQSDAGADSGAVQADAEVDADDEMKEAAVATRVDTTAADGNSADADDDEDVCGAWCSVCKSVTTTVPAAASAPKVTRRSGADESRGGSSKTVSRAADGEAEDKERWPVQNMAPMGKTREGVDDTWADRRGGKATAAENRIISRGCDSASVGMRHTHALPSESTVTNAWVESVRINKIMNGRM